MILDIEQIKLYLNISVGNGEYDKTILAFGDIVTSVMEGKLDLPITATTYEEIYSGNGLQRLTLNKYPILRLASAEASADTQTNPGPVDTESLQYRIDAGGWVDLLTDMSLVYIDSASSWQLQLIGGTTFPRGRNNIRVKYVAGYDTIPGELSKQFLERVTWMLRESNSPAFGSASLLGIQSNSSGALGTSGSTSYQDLEARWDKQLDAYRKLI
jgi:hypothetical protein